MSAVQIVTLFKLMHQTHSLTHSRSPCVVALLNKACKAKTSSFPSRAVTCALVYSFAFGFALYLKTGLWEVEWWILVFTIVSVPLASFARVYLGVHYPTDCLGAIIQVSPVPPPPPPHHQQHNNSNNNNNNYLHNRDSI
jgi:hypothetical protein